MRYLMGLVRVLVGPRPESGKNNRSELLTIWFIAVAIIALFMIAVPAAGFSEASSKMSALQASRQAPSLGWWEKSVLTLSILSAVIGSIASGGVLKIAADYSPARWSFYVLLIFLVGLATIADAIGILRDIFGAQESPSGHGTKTPLAFYQGGWVLWWASTLSILFGWTLKAPWDRCTKRTSDHVANMVNYLGKPDRFTRRVATIIAPAQVASMEPDIAKYDHPKSAGHHLAR